MPTLVRPAGGLAGLLAVEVEYRAHKLIFSTDTTARMELLSSGSAAALLLTPPFGTPVPLPPEGVARLVVETELPFGRREVVRLLLDPRTGGALQSDKVGGSGGRVRTVSRYMSDGVYMWHWRPANRAEAALTPESWTARDEQFSRYPDGLPKEAVVTEGYALLPLAEAARLDRSATGLRLYVFSHELLLALDFVGEGIETRSLDVDEESPSGRHLRSGARLVRMVRVSARAVGDGAAPPPDELRVLGFLGAVTLSLDTGTGVPVAMTGRAAVIGNLTARLVRVRYAAGPPRVE
ncbi:MAG: hypothetical protein ACHQQS_07720 [Thermoanaerobaculales bacterium]